LLQMDLRNLRERAKTVNYAVTGLHLTHTPGWLKGDTGKVKKTTFTHAEDKENDPNIRGRGPRKRQSAPARQAERVSPNNPAKGDTGQGARRISGEVVKGRRQSNDGNKPKSGKEGAQNGSPPSSGDRKRRTSSTSGQAKGKRQRTAQVEPNKGSIVRQEENAGAGTSGNVLDSKKRTEALLEQGSMDPVPSQQRVTRRSRRLSKSVDGASGFAKNDSLEATVAVLPEPAVETTTAEPRENELLPPTTSAEENTCTQAPAGSPPRGGAGPNPPEGHVTCNKDPPLRMYSETSLEERQSANFLALQVRSSLQSLRNYLWFLSAKFLLVPKVQSHNFLQTVKLLLIHAE
jgi:hypothetical protein